LFVQSDFGIVTAATIKLARPPERVGMLLFQSFSEMGLGRYVAVLSELKAEGTILSVPHIGDRVRYCNTVGPSLPKERLNALYKKAPAWFGLIPVGADRESFDSKCRYIQRRLGPDVEVQIVEEPKSATDQFLVNLVQGRPSNLPLASVSFAALGTPGMSLDLDGAPAGLIHITPTCTPDKVLDLLTGIRNQLVPGLNMALTFNVVNPGLVVAVISIAYDRRSETEAALAKKAAKNLSQFAFSQPYMPYRLGLATENPLAANPLHERLRIIFDPDAIFSPSKYRGTV
jgi:hypothetical protein